MTIIPTPAAHLTQEYDQQKALFEEQPAIIKHFLDAQARIIANGLVSKTSQIQFSLPDRVFMQVKQVGQQAEVTIPAAQREQRLGSPLDSLLQHDVREKILYRLQQLEQSPDQAIAVSANLLRYSAASYMVSSMLPSGRSVTYRPDDDEAIPSIPVSDDAPESAITQADDAIAEQGDIDNARGELQSPFIPAARIFFLPQWVSFDADGKLITGTEKEADANIQSMQKYVQILHRASSLASYMVACDEYQRKRYGILGQLINQGRALAAYKTTTIIRTINRRVEKGSLNRGLSISMPYFDDQNLELVETRFEVIPAGRILFVPAFIVRASRGEQANVSQDTRLNSSTRKHLLAQLKALENAFISK
ncbi:MAG: hypothetical protein WCP19_08105 [Chloroflexota bacterium]